MQQNRTFLLTILVLVGAVVSSMGVVGPVSRAYASILGNLGSGYDDGKQQAIADWNSGKTFNDSCPYDALTYVSYCAGYAAGYNVGWQSEKNLQP
jgi:hypothetical protein